MSFCVCVCMHVCAQVMVLLLPHFDRRFFHRVEGHFTQFIRLISVKIQPIFFFYPQPLLCLCKMSRASCPTEVARVVVALVAVVACIQLMQVRKHPRLSPDQFRRKLERYFLFQLLLSFKCLTYQQRILLLYIQFLNM